MRDVKGDGLVVIWGLDLPFLPGSRQTSSESLPAISVAHYRDGQQVFYLLQDHPGSDWSLDTDGSGNIGQSSFEVRRRSGTVSLKISLDEPVPQSAERFTAEIVFEGPAIDLPSIGDDVAHLWAPYSLHGNAHADLNYGAKTVVLEGGAYLDSNASALPLHNQQIAAWRWGRVRFPQHTLAYYEIEGTNGDCERYVIQQDRDGVTTQPTTRIEFEQFETGTYGLTSPTTARLTTTETAVRISTAALVEDGPFYSRSLTMAINQDGETGLGVAEVVRPTHLDIPWQRPLVRMRTHRVGRTNSPFLPLFAGARTDRGLRLLRSFFSPIGAP